MNNSQHSRLSGLFIGLMENREGTVLHYSIGIRVSLKGVALTWACIRIAVILLVTGTNAISSSVAR